MYLPPVEKKPLSPILRWTLRGFLFLCVVVVLIFTSLNILSGTSETHKRGLEQAAQDLTGKKVLFQKLVSFNIIPQFRIEIDGVMIDNMRIEHLMLAYGFWDLVKGHPFIEDIKIKDFYAPAGSLGPATLKIDNAQIDSDSTFRAVGSWGDDQLKFNIPLQIIANRYRKAYEVVNPQLYGTIGAYTFEYGFEKDKKRHISLTHAGKSQRVEFNDMRVSFVNGAVWIVTDDLPNSCDIIKISMVDNKSMINISPLAQENQITLESQNIVLPPACKNSLEKQ